MKNDPDLAERLRAKLKIPVMAGPMFIASMPELVVAQCRSGIIGAMPALNARTSARLDADIVRIKQELHGCDVPFAINLVAHKTNERLDADLAIIVKHRVPIVVRLRRARRSLRPFTLMVGSSSTTSSATGTRANAPTSASTALSPWPRAQGAIPAISRPSR
jgi:NAD(P)H-dependent flavin oxidoreductase YrpB (nitropropane dioxygenase family)